MTYMMDLRVRRFDLWHCGSILVGVVVCGMEMNEENQPSDASYKYRAIL